MVLDDIISEYKKRIMNNPKDATSFILDKFQGKNGQVLNREYLCLFMCGSEGYGYDPFNGHLYQVDLNPESLDFRPENGEVVLFKKKGMYLKPAINSTGEKGIFPAMRKLEIIKNRGIAYAFVYDSNQKYDKKCERIDGKK